MQNQYFANCAGCLVMVLFLLLSTKLPADEQKPVDFTLIEKHARWAQIAYQPESSIGELVAARDYELMLYHTFADTQISFFLATNESTKSQVISVRGTSNVENAIVDLYLKLIVDKKTGVPLHHGFSVGARQIYASVKPVLKPGYKIDVTGHSLGGAVALILAIYLDADQYQIGQITTFGQPKVTNVGGADKIQHINIVRVVTPLDVVPLVPFFDPLDINNIDIYWHAGKEVILLADNEYAILEGTDSMMRAGSFTQRLLNEQNMQHHLMSLYLKLIKAKTQTSVQVPYKSNSSLFNLFGG